MSLADPVVIFIMTLGLICISTSGVAYSCYKFMTIFPDLNILICVILSGLVTAFVE